MNVNDVFKKYDPKEEAKWKDYKGLKFLIAPVGSVSYKNALLKNLTLKQATAIEAEGPAALDMPGDEALSKIYKIYSDSVVLDWDGVKNGEKELKFSKEKVLEWMNGFDEFANFVVSASHEIREEVLKEQAEVEKN